MDCVDCHNRATHVYENPERAIDERMALGLLDRRLPYLKREALAALTGSYADTVSAMQGIRARLQAVYARESSAETAGLEPAIDGAVRVLQGAYRRNVHPLMNVGWDAYPDQRGHRGGGGCFRCHNSDLVDPAGNAVPHECTLCHSMLAYDSESPFEFLEPPGAPAPDLPMREYLRGEFLRSQTAEATSPSH
jgi:hypothetical protein